MRTPGNPFALQLFVALLCELARAVCLMHAWLTHHEPCRPWSFQHEPWQAHFPEEGAVACWGWNPVSAKGVVHSQQTAFRATPHLSRALPERASLTGLWPWRWFSSVSQPVELPISPQQTAAITCFLTYRAYRCTSSMRQVCV